MAKTDTSSSKVNPKNKGIDDRPKMSSLPSGGGRKSVAPDAGASFITKSNQYRTVTPAYIREIVPIIRMLMMQNPDVGQAIHNIVTLGNTGHKIFFDRKVGPDQADLMRNHINNKRRTWASGQAGMDGLVNRWFAQILVGGALSTEWVPDKDLKGIESVILVNPEDIEFTLNKKTTIYEPYQRTNSILGIKGSGDMGLVKLNTNTYRYFSLNGDGEVPYGFPPYMSVIPRVSTQINMDKNINFVIDQMGLVGFIEALIQKPDYDDSIDKNDSNYRARLDGLLTQAKERVLSGFKEGVVVGYKDDHEFNFNSASKTFGDVVQLYDNNELMLASALKQDASMWGRAYATSETQITVVFIKMISELKNIQNLIKENLRFGYELELRLAGFNFDFLDVRFNKSTIQDDLKSQQADEIKIRNVKDKLIMGIIDQDQAADELGYETPAEKEPRVPWEVLAGGKDPNAEGALATDATKKKADTKKKKTASDTKKRQQGKPLPK